MRNQSLTSDMLHFGNGRCRMAISDYNLDSSHHSFFTGRRDAHGAAKAIF